jgi:glycerol-3-phosphate dehydrogenase (NAD(P)+)
MKLGIIGGGAWGTAIAVQASIALGSSEIYVRDAKIVKLINQNHINSKYLPNILLPKTLRATSNIDEIFQNDIIGFAIPSKFLKEVVDSNFKKIRKNHILIIATKGLDNGNLNFFSSYFQDKLQNNNICILSGPNFASEVASRKLSIASLASENFELARNLSILLSTDSFIIYPSSDIISIQLSSCIKNIVAIAIGISHGFGNGDNFRAFLIAQGANEIKKLSTLLGGGNNHNSFDIAGIGDLILTCTSMNSRNTNFGFQLTRAKNPKDFINTFPNLVEGKEAIAVIYKLSRKYDVNLPIISNTYRLITKLQNIGPITHTELNEIYADFFAKIISEVKENL